MTEALEPKLFEQVLERKFGWSTCFLCGCRLGKKNRSDEHVFPKWLQRKYKLVDERLRLPNGTTVPYRQLTIPCCRVCNTKHLHPIEKTMSQAVIGGPRAVKALDPWYIFIWLGKMFYGILYRELFLLWDRARGNKGTITTKEILREYRMHHLLLQSVRVPMQFVGCFPASILIVETQEPEDKRLSWDYSDDPQSMFIGCRMGSVGLICMLHDGGAQQAIFPRCPGLDIDVPHKLHPIQFREVLARVRYQGMLFNRIPKFVLWQSEEETKVTMNPLMGFNSKPIFDPWNQLLYSRVLATMTGAPIKLLFRAPDRAWTWLKTPAGTLSEMPLKQYPVSCHTTLHVATSAGSLGRSSNASGGDSPDRTRGS